ncbi:adhesion G-protein coupled receptor V1-like [Mercenaria mercenaria]|uniref:adhesion G-protein coupled receptor V1-like n=1 Tax=Mercenaria mercenaria TaxID=6596 RepID=UPI00234F5C9F|nr:adhesion G-protein coupled receptor V1-like [Mercenaria mercenaria]
MFDCNYCHLKVLNSHITGSTVVDDITPTSGTIFYVSNEASKKFQISVLPDDHPEGQEDFKIKLTSVTAGRIGTRDVFTLSIQSNDNPHGVVEFAQTRYSVEEQSTDSQETLLLSRTGGSFGQLRVYYMTAKVMYVQDDVLETGDGVLNFFHSPRFGGRGTQGEDIPVLPTEDPVKVCAVACLRKISCSAFEVYFFDNTRSCTLHDTTGSLQIMSSSFQYYEKDIIKAGELTGVDATPGDDYTVVTSGYVLIEQGETSGEIPVTIKADSIPELDEKFVVVLTRVDVSGEPPSAKNTPYLGETRNATVTILANDDTYGAFTVYSNSPLSSENGHVIQVEEKENLAVELIVERQGGTIGEVSIDWSVDLAASTAIYNVDFRADGATLSFLPGDTRKLISVTVLDDTQPELAKNIVVRLSNVQGGATIKYDNATVVILENDNIAGVISLSTTSLLAEEGDTVSVDVLRSPSQFGTVTVNWEIQGLGGLNPSQSFQVYEGSLEFLPGENRKTVVLDVLRDNIPELNEEYQLFLTTIRTTGVGISGAATFDPLLRTASITIEGSNNPHGVVQFGSDSLNVRVNEATGTVNIQVDRKFGDIGQYKAIHSLC